MHINIQIDGYNLIREPVKKRKTKRNHKKFNFGMVLLIISQVLKQFWVNGWRKINLFLFFTNRGIHP